MDNRVLRLSARRVLLANGEIRPSSLTIVDGRIVAIDEGIRDGTTDLGDRLLAPALVDVHGDAFERQIMPRPGVMVDLGVGLIDTDRQLAANGVATAFHGLTWSWEPGLRSVQTGLQVIEWFERASQHLACDHRIHLRFENHNLDGLDQLLALIKARRVGLLAFNDHTPKMAADAAKPSGNIGNAYRACVPVATFNAQALAAAARGGEVPTALQRLAALAKAHRIPMLSHDTASIAEWRHYAALGCSAAEFPLNLETANATIATGKHVVMGAPNVLRGKSHMGWVSALELIAAGACDILASDYYYPALLQAPFRIAAAGLLPLGAAWRLVAANPAATAGLSDRGSIDLDCRADLVAVEEAPGLPPRVVQTWRGGRSIFGPAP